MGLGMTSLIKLLPNNVEGPRFSLQDPHNILGMVMCSCNFSYEEAETGVLAAWVRWLTSLA